ncbi:MAG: ComEA family DNA-binding protein [Bryobacteraceae bacterium]
MTLPHAVRAAAVLFLLPGAATPSAYPERPGKKAVEKLCGGCHGLQLMAPMRRGKDAWRKSVEDMLGKGMKAEEEEMEEVIAYLARYLSRLNINKAAAADIADILDLPEAQAAAIVAYREKHGDFKNFDDLARVPGADPGKLAEQRDRIAFSARGAL